tara:strand:- start:244 stop:390 length:147 start_codon:yes stop_codon:yes gene_type:complete
VKIETCRAILKNSRTNKTNPVFFKVLEKNNFIKIEEAGIVFNWTAKIK